MTHAFIITRDCLEKRDITVIGPRNANDGLVAQLKDGGGRAFRMLDDDGEVYYEGRILTSDGPGSQDDFAPLDCYGEPNAGCTSIQYRQGAVWKSL
jgi:hypothetical protein